MMIYDQLARALPAGTVIGPAGIEPRYLSDWVNSNEEVIPAALVRPRTTEDVSLTMRICSEQGVPVVAQGGRTGLAGGAVPSSGWVIISLERMRAIEDVDTASGTVLVEAGAVLEAVQNAADAADLLFPLDIGGRGTCTIGGNLSTNAGGNRVLRYGMMRDLVLGLEVVLADGTVVSSLNKMLKNNTGYDLKQLFVGSEGTLGIITKAVLRLFPKPRSRATALCGLTDYEAVLRLLALSRSRLGANLSAFEVMWPVFYRAGTEGAERRAPLPQGFYAYVLVEAMGTDPDGDPEDFQAFIELAAMEGVIEDAVIARSIKEIGEIWSVRDAAGELGRVLGPLVGFDISIPVGDIGRYLETCTERLRRRWSDIVVVSFGHAADSNIHLGMNVPSLAEQPEHEIEAIVYDCVSEFAGSISAEHGIGTHKLAYLDRSRNPAEIAVMKTIKAALDPKRLLNPGKVFV